VILTRSQLPLVAISCITIYFVVNIPIRNTTKGSLARVDFLGSFVLVTSLVCLLVGLNSGGNTLPWSHPLVISMLVAGIVLLVIFGIVEEKYATEPVIMVRLFLKKTVTAACLTNWFYTMSVYSFLYYAPIFFRLAGNSSTAAGLRLIPYRSVS